MSRSFGTWTEHEISVAEHIINPDDIRIYIFDGADRIVSEIVPSELPWETDGNDGFYSITASMEKSVIDRFSDVGNGRIKFKLAIVANLQSVGSAYPRIMESAEYSSIDPEFNMSADYYPSATSGIPMYGVREYVFNRSNLESATVSRPCELKEEIVMLRSLCKVELRDVMTNKFTVGGMSYPRIDRVEMSEWNSAGYVRFDSDKDDSYMTDGTLNSARINAGTSVGRKMFSSNGSGTYRVYIPEGSLSESTVSMWVTRGPGEESEEFVYNMSEADAFGTPDLVRNHVYTLEVIKVGVTARIESGIKPWVGVEVSTDDDEPVRMSRYLSWVDVPGCIVLEGDGNGKKPELHIYEDVGDYAEGIFEIESPSDAVWTMQIIPGLNGVNAFEFVTVDENGKISGSASQIVSGNTGEKSHVYLRGVGESPSVDSHADLVLTVRDAGNVTRYAPMDTYQNRYFGLIRHSPMF